ncbi:DUF4371 domain-containing protein [Trichonephila clavipes]|nr:DUF4371 domain-containing protein [Trichonephila clavipes]
MNVKDEKKLARYPQRGRRSMMKLKREDPRENHSIYVPEEKNSVLKEVSSCEKNAIHPSNTIDSFVFSPKYRMMENCFKKSLLGSHERDRQEETREVSSVQTTENDEAEERGSKRKPFHLLSRGAEFCSGRILFVSKECDTPKQHHRFFCIPHEKYRTRENCFRTVGSLVVRASDSRSEGLVIVEVEIVGVAIYRPFGGFRRAKSYCHLYGAQGQRQAYLFLHATMNFVGLDLTMSDRSKLLQTKDYDLQSAMELLKSRKDFFKDLRSETAINEMLCDAREFPDELDILANFELTQPRHTVRRKNVNFDYEARDDPTEDPTWN